MRMLFSALLALALWSGLSGSVRAADAKDVTPILDKAIKALGGPEKLGKIKAATWKTKGTITFMGADNETSGQITVQGLDHYRQDFEGMFNGNTFKAVT